jgi:Zn-dependent peptidase ImmA (M78 family)
LRLDTGDVRGASLRGTQGGAFALVNSQDVESNSGRLFTLLHEYGHLVAAENSVCSFRGDEERLANRFAARMLLGLDELRHRLGELGRLSQRANWSDDLLDEIRRPLFVSRDVVTLSLQELQLAPADLYARKRGMWSSRKPGGRGRGMAKKRAEQRLTKLGYSFTKLVSSRQVEENASPLELAYLLDVKVERLSELLRELRDATAG